MVSPATGAVVLVRFPFSDLSQSKLRPAVVLADAERGDWILCQVTSRSYGDARAVALAESDFSRGGLRVQSHARPGKLFTANSEIMAAASGLRFHLLLPCEIADGKVLVADDQADFPLTRLAPHRSAETAECAEVLGILDVNGCRVAVDDYRSPTEFVKEMRVAAALPW